MYGFLYKSTAPMPCCQYQYPKLGQIKISGKQVIGTISKRELSADCIQNFAFHDIYERPLKASVLFCLIFSFPINGSIYSFNDISSVISFWLIFYVHIFIVSMARIDLYLFMTAFSFSHHCPMICTISDINPMYIPFLLYFLYAILLFLTISISPLFSWLHKWPQK